MLGYVSSYIVYLVYVAIGLNLCILLEDLNQKDEKEHFVPKEIAIPSAPACWTRRKYIDGQQMYHHWLSAQNVTETSFR